MSSTTLASSENMKKFSFIDKKFESISGKENKESLIKWYI
jgi:hypothetical protein